MIAPLRFSDLITVRLAIDQDVECVDGAVGRERERIGDEFMLPDDIVDDEPPEQLAALFSAPDLLRRALTRSAQLFDLLALLIRQRELSVHESLRSREHCLLSLRDRQILCGECID